MTDYVEAPKEVYTIKNKLVNSHHPHLKDARFEFVFRKETWTSRGKVAFAAVRKAPGYTEGIAKNKPYPEGYEYDFIVEVAEETYVDMTADRREALIDYALSHCGMGSNGWRINPPDFEGFLGNVERYGHWTVDLLNARRSFEKAIQAELPGLEEEGSAEAIVPEVIVEEPAGEPA